MKKEFAQNINDALLIPKIVKIFVEQNKMNKELLENQPIDVIISTDAFSIEMWSKDKNLFIYECLPLSGMLSTFPLHMESTINRHASLVIENRIRKCADIL